MSCQWCEAGSHLRAAAVLLPLLQRLRRKAQGCLQSRDQLPLAHLGPPADAVLPASRTKSSGGAR